MSLPVTKKYRCRYYGPDGFPVPGGPICNNGAECRFVHPSDPNWPGKTPFIDTRLKKDSGRGPPLAPQSDLFQRRKGNDDRGRSQKDWDRSERIREREKNRNHRNRSTTPMRPSPRSRAVPDSERKGDARVEPRTTPNVEPSSKDDFSSRCAEKWGSPLRKTEEKQHSDEEKRAERIVGLFRSLANISNELVTATAAQEHQGKKLQTYTEISSTLAKVSQSAASSVAPALADIMIRHEQCKHRVDQNFKALGGLWDEVFDVFCNEIAGVIDVKLQDAIGVLKEASDDAQSPGKRGRIEADDDLGKGDSSSGSKRRRINEGTSPTDESVGHILAQMKMKIDEQAYSLQVLTKENTELKHTLKQSNGECRD